jgi:hypothetical protein
MHHAVMQELVTNPAMNLPRGADRTAILCAALEDAILRHARDAEQRLGVMRSEATLQQEVRKVLYHKAPCDEARTALANGGGFTRHHVSLVSNMAHESPMATLRSVLPKLSVPSAAHEAVEDTVYLDGTFQTYVDILVDGIENDLQSVNQVGTLADSILALAEADSILEGDLILLAGFVELVTSSADEWASFDWESSGAMPDECDEVPEPMPIEVQEEWEEFIETYCGEEPADLLLTTIRQSHDGVQDLYVRAGTFGTAVSLVHLVDVNDVVHAARPLPKWVKRALVAAAIDLGGGVTGAALYLASLYNYAWILIGLPEIFAAGTLSQAGISAAGASGLYLISLLA